MISHFINISLLFHADCAPRKIHYRLPRYFLPSAAAFLMNADIVRRHLAILAHYSIPPSAPPPLIIAASFRYFIATFFHAIFILYLLSSVRRQRCHFKSVYRSDHFRCRASCFSDAHLSAR